MIKTKLLINLLSYIILSFLIYFISNNYILKEEEKLLDRKYTTISSHMKKNLSTLIEDKKNATLAFALSASKDKKIKDALIKKDHTNIDYKSFSKELREKTKFKNVWFQIIDKNGQSFYRSWTNRKNDSVLFRDDVKKIMKDKKMQTSISVGRFDMTFKTMIPIFDKSKLLGVFEIITHFNSISRILEKDNIDSIVLADKQYKEDIIYPFTKKFIGDYYIANLNAKDYLVKLLEENNLEELLKIQNYKLIQENLLTTFTILELEGKTIGYVALAKNLKHIDVKDVESFKQTSLVYVVIFIVLIGFLFTIITYYLYSNDIKKMNSQLEENFQKIKTQERKNQTILDSQKNIIVITDGEKLKNANMQFLNFFDEYSSLEEFKEDHDCVCERFIERDDDSYVVEKDYDGKNWAEHILANPDKNFKAAMFKENKLHHFATSVNLSQFEDEETPYIIVTLTDITHEIEQQEQLKKLNENLESIVEEKTKELKELNEDLEEKIKEEIKKSKDKDRLLFQQSKLAAMGEMLENIAHQWRQPLNSISTSATSMKLQNELKLLDETQVNTSCDFILKSSQYLSRTIEDFKNYFKQDKEKQDFLLKDSMLENLGLLKDKVKHESIQILLEIDNDISIYGFKNEFQQATLNILNNCVDALSQTSSNKNRIIIIKYEENTLSIKDNAGGVDEEIIEKVFEPYFTTKHQSQGTGIGLYMTEEILKKHMNCLVQAQNEEFNYNEKTYTGFNITIKFPS